MAAKRFIIYLLFFFFSVIAVSCNETVVPDGGRKSIDFVFMRTDTRSSVSAYEENIVSLDLLVFRADNGAIDTYKRFTGSSLSSVSIDLLSGVSFKWYMFANLPAGKFDGIVSENSLASLVTSLDESTAISLAMFDSGSVMVYPSSNPPVQVGLDRYGCKITLKNFKVSWLDSFADVPSVSLEKIAVINTVGTCPLSGIPAVGSLWYNKMNVDSSLSGIVADMLVKDYGSSIVSDSGILALDDSLYCLPNPTNNSVNSVTNPQWSPRNTRFALLLLVDGNPNWYAFDIPSMLCNKHYVINSFDITGPGMSSPDEPLSRTGIELSLSLVEWTDNDIYGDF